MKEVRFTFPGNLTSLRNAAKASKEVCLRIEGSRIDDNFARDVELCVSEAFTNAIKYGGSVESENPVTLYFQVFPNKLTIKVKDKGKGFDLENLPEPDLMSLSGRGYGLYIIRSKMEHVRYIRKIGGNILTMTRYFKKK